MFEVRNMKHDESGQPVEVRNMIGENLKIVCGCSFDSHEEAVKELEIYQIDTQTKFSVHATDGGYNNEDFELEKHKILFEDIKRPNKTSQIEYNGVPFIVLGTKRYDCIHGKDRSITTKRKYKEAKLKQANNEQFDFRYRTSRKMNCPAAVTIRNIILFYKYKATANTKGCKRTVTEKLRKKWKTDKDSILFKRSFLVQFPTIDSHCNHLINEINPYTVKKAKRKKYKNRFSVGEATGCTCIGHLILQASNP